MGTDKQGRRSNVLGPVGQRLNASLKSIREQRGLSTRRLAERLTELGRPMQATAITKIEAGDRRVDVDDLVALAVALDVSPSTLLLPPEPVRTSKPLADQHPGGWPVQLTEKISAPWEVAWRWMHGEMPHDSPDTNAWAPEWIPPNRPYESDVLTEVQEFLDRRVRNPFTIELERDGRNHYDKAEMSLKSLRPSPTMKPVGDARRERDQAKESRDDGADLD